MSDTTSRAEDWVVGYLKAWASDEPDDIGALFTEDARYYTEPFAEAWEGRHEIVVSWQEASDAGMEWSFEHEVVADCDDVAVIRGVTRYAAGDGEPGKEYHNLWLVRFAEDGRAREFTEWWMLAKKVPLPETLVL